MVQGHKLSRDTFVEVTNLHQEMSQLKNVRQKRATMK